MQKFITFLLLSVCHADHLLLVGESVDRFITQEYCQLQRSKGLKTLEFQWGDGTIKYANESSAEDPYVDTVKRIPQALSLYKANVGVPSRILLQTAKWDIQYIHNRYTSEIARASDLWNTSLYHFKLSLNDRVSQILDIVAQWRQVEPNISDIDVGLRTGAWGEMDGELFHDFNTITRQISLERNLTMFDLDNDLWSSVDFNRSMQFTHLFRDRLHPNPLFTGPAAEKMLGRRYSSFMRFAPNSYAANEFEVRVNAFRLKANDSNWGRINFQSTLIRNSSSPPILVAIAEKVTGMATTTTTTTTTRSVVGFGDNKDLFFYLDGKRYPNVTQSFCQQLGVGISHIFDMDSTTLSYIPLGESIPSLIFEEGAVVNSTHFQHTYLKKNHILREIPSVTAATSLAKEFEATNQRLRVIKEKVGQDYNPESPSIYTFSSTPRKTDGVVGVYVNETNQFWLNLIPLGGRDLPNVNSKKG